MIKFIYNKGIEQSIFNEHVLARKNPAVCKMIKDELDVEIDGSDKYVSSQISYIQAQWNIVSAKFLKALGDFYCEQISEPDLTCYLTRLDIFPYKYDRDGKENKGWFSAPLFGNPAERNRVIMHELVHYFQPSALTEVVKEAIPTILNDNDKFCMYSIDRGHSNPEEQSWRKIIWDIYKKGGKFSDVQSYVKQNK